MKRIFLLLSFSIFLYNGLCLMNPCFAFDPLTAKRLVYENPKGCDEVSGTVTFRASVKGTGAPIPETMKYEIRTEKNGTPVTLIGNKPSYEVAFDTTTVRDGMVFYTAVPSFASDNSATLAGILPRFRGIMVNNHQLDLTRPLIIIGSPMQPYSGPFDGWDSQELKNMLMFAYNLDAHLQDEGIPIPKSCFEDTTATVLNPSNPLESTPTTFFDLEGDSISGTPFFNAASACFANPFWSISGPNGFRDLDENTALGYLQLIAKLNAEDLNATPQIIGLYSEIVNKLTCNFNQVGDWYNTFEYNEPVRNGEPIHRLKEKLKALVNSEGITSVLVFGNYHKSSDWEVSTDAWPAFQEAVDEINTELGTSIRIGSITNNNHRLMDYEGFLRSQYLAMWELVKSANIPAGKKVGLIIAGHGSSETTRLYDVSATQNPVLSQRLKDYISARAGSIYSPTTPVQLCYSEYSNTLEDGAPGVGEQVQQWKNENYDYIFIYPMEWMWQGTETMEGLRRSAVDLVDSNNQDIYLRDVRGRSAVTIGTTKIIVGETIFEQKPYNEAPYHFYRASNTRLLEDRMIELTQFAPPTPVLGTTTIKGGAINLSLAFSDSLLAQENKMTFQNAGITGAVSILSGLIDGTVNANEMSQFIFALLAENGFNIKKVEVHTGTIHLQELPSVSGYIEAPQVTAVFADQTINVDVKITIAPTLISLSSFHAAAAHRQVALAWTTESEINNAGFNLYRSESQDGEYIKINDALIAGLGTAVEGSAYTYLDKGLTDRKTYWYKLEDVDLNGTKTQHGPVSATPRLLYGLF
ncbi:MAG: hypothetical protein WCQ99_04330 [Pseudomonadota bacterium]